MNINSGDDYCRGMVHAGAEMGLLRKMRNYTESRVFKAVVSGLGAIAVVTQLLHPFFAGPINPTAGDPTLNGSFVTRRGEHRCEKLPDSSKVCLNTNSEVRYSFNGHTRNIEIAHGEASFVVRKDPRAFDVLSGGILVHDISTIFDVYKKRHSTVVTVVEGRVRVIGPVTIESRLKFDLGEAESDWKTAVELRKSQQVEFDEVTGTLHKRPELADWQLSQLLAWEGGRIDLNGRALGDALDEFARYQPISKFRYPASIGKVHVGGSLEFDSLDDLLAGLEKEFHIHASKAGTGEDTVVTLSWQRPPPENTGRETRP